MEQQELVRNVVQEVLERLGPGTSVTTAAPRAGSASGRFADVESAVETASRAQRQLATAGKATRAGICALIRRLARENARAWGDQELAETGIGRADHKVAKLELLASIEGPEALDTRAHSGDDGVGLDEAAPWGVIGVITPVTHSVPTMAANAIHMIAAGNALVVNPHPSGAGSAATAAEAINRAVAEQYGIDPLICVMDPPTLETADAIFRHERVALLVVTGGPAVARAALSQQKRAIVAGPGNPPVVVDETADLDRAARCIVEGAAFDNNLLCIGEKQVFAVDAVFDDLLAAMQRAGAEALDEAQTRRLADAAFAWESDHYVLNKDLVGQGPQALGHHAGARVGAATELLFAETRAAAPFVTEEQMMPFVPFVRVPDFERGLELAVDTEHGFGHTAVIHSRDLDRITRMGRTINTTIFVANGSSLAGLGVGGEGYPSYSIATPTGEGVTNPRTFTRFRRGAVAGSLRMV